MYIVEALKLLAEQKASFGPYLQELRVRAGFTLRQAADKVGVSNPFISQIETGKQNPPKPELLVKLARAYGVDPVTVLDRAGYFGVIGKREKRLMDRARDSLAEDPEILGRLGK